jgi:hypothetical protein
MMSSLLHAHRSMHASRMNSGGRPVMTQRLLVTGSRWALTMGPWPWLRLWTAPV